MDKLYDLAFAYRKTKLWKNLADSQLFAVAMSDGEIGYCSVMGMAGEHYALALYAGDAGLRSYSMVLEDAPSFGGLHGLEQALAQDCVMCSFENRDELRECEAELVRAYCAANQLKLRGANAWPQFQRVRPYHMPWTLVEDEDKVRMAEGLEAALEVARRLEGSIPSTLGLLEGPPYDREIPLLVKTEEGYDWQTVTLPPHQELDYPTAGPLYDLTLKRAAMKRGRSGVWGCNVFLMPTPSCGEGPEDPDNLSEMLNSPAPYFPWAQMIIDLDSGAVLDDTVCNENEDYAEVLPNKLLELIGTHGKPREMMVDTERGFALYRDLAKKVGFPLNRIEMDEDEEELFDRFLEHMMSEFDGDDDEDDDEDDGEYPLLLRNNQSELMELVKDLLFSCGNFENVPSEMLMPLLSIAEELGPELPEGYCHMIRQELDKRFP